LLLARAAALLSRIAPLDPVKRLLQHASVFEKLLAILAQGQQKSLAAQLQEQVPSSFLLY
jgi:hypothetical protein